MTGVIYNVTVNVSDEAKERWLAWVQQSHLPEILKSGFFTKALLAKVNALDYGGTTYAIQYFAPSHDHYQRYLQELAPRIYETTQQLFADQLHSFQTLLEVVNTFEVQKR
jgi:hypothetical protein